MNDAELLGAVRVAYDQTVDPKLKAQAEQCVSQFQKSPECWSFCVGQLRKARVDPVILFWVLSALVQLTPKRFSEISEQEKGQFQDLLLDFLAREIAPQALPQWVKNKFAQLLVV
eukprot:RCo002850